jgi:hypothetical protein
LKKSIQEVEPGMTRSDVVDVVGSPIHVHRNTTDHVWVYRYYDDDQRIWVKKAVYFKDDVVAKVGEPPKRDVVLKNPYPDKGESPLEVDTGKKPIGAIKKAPGVGSEDWYQEIKQLEKSELEKEKQKTIPDFKPVN